MKRLLRHFLFLSLIFLLSVNLVGCGSGNAPEKAETEETVSETDSAADNSVEGIEGYTTYADYDAVKADPAEVVQGENPNILVAYFSRSGNTDIPEGVDAVSSASLTVNEDGTTSGNAEQIAQWIADETGGDLALIQTEYTYPLDYEELVEVGEGQDEDGYIPELASNIEDMDKYDTVYLVYPIWHYTLASPVRSFLEKYDLNGKTIYAFSANGGSRFADSIEVIQDAEPGATVVEGASVSADPVEEAKETVIAKVRELNSGTESGTNGESEDSNSGASEN